MQTAAVGVWDCLRVPKLTPGPGPTAHSLEKGILERKSRLRSPRCQVLCFPYVATVSGAEFLKWHFPGKNFLVFFGNVSCKTRSPVDHWRDVPEASLGNSPESGGSWGVVSPRVGKGAETNLEGRWDVTKGASIPGSEVSSGLRFIPVGRHHDGERPRDVVPEPGCGNVP